MKKYLLVAGVCALFTTQANAGSIKPYVGLDFGASRIKYSDQVGDGNSDTFAVANLNFGIKFNQFFGLEFSSQGSSETDIKGLGDLSYSSIGLDAVGYIPLNTKLELFAMAGIGYYNFDLKINDTYDVLPSDLELHATADETAFRAGLGVQYNINDKWALRGLARYHYIDNDYFKHIGDISVGVRYNF